MSKLTKTAFDKGGFVNSSIGVWRDIFLKCVFIMGFLNRPKNQNFKLY